MKRVQVRFYAELNDFLPAGRKARDLEHAFHVSPSVKDVIEGFGVPHTEVDLILVNGESEGFGRRVRDGDRISVYPVFESIDIRPVLKVRPDPLRVTRFVLDTHLGRLAAYLRMAGFDAIYDNHADDENLARISRAEHRILLTRDRGLLKRSLVTHGYCVRETRPAQQLHEIFERFDLSCAARPFRRCLSCNAVLIPVAREVIADRVPPRAFELFTEFRLCPGCGKVFWTGSHYRRMEKLLQDAIRPPARIRVSGR